MSNTGQSSMKTIGICGGGKMGVSFFNYLIRFHYPVIFYVRNQEKLMKIKNNYMKRLSSKSKSRDGMENEPEKVHFTQNIEELADADIVFEFITESLEEKSAFIRKLVLNKANPKQVIATGSSSLVPSKLSPAFADENIIGVHFIYPVQYIKTVEVIFGKQTPLEVIDGVKAFLLAIEKSPMLLDEETGSITTKALINLQNEAFLIAKEYNLPFHIIDEIVAKEDYSIPPFELTDSVGHDVIHDSIKGHFDGTEEAIRFEAFKKQLEMNIHQGILGKKSGKGFLDLDSPAADAKGISAMEQSVVEEISNRLRMAYIHPCLKMLDQCKVNLEELDRVFCELNQTENGPVKIAFADGMEGVLKTLEYLHEKYGAYFKPPAFVQYIAKMGLGRDEVDRQLRMFEMGGKRPDWHRENFG